MPTDGKFEETGELIHESFKISNSKLEKLSPCNLHVLLSKQGIKLVRKDKVTGKYYGWDVIYLGTYRNLVITPP